MVACLLFSIFAVMCLRLTTEGAEISHFDSKMEYVEGFSSPRLYCDVNSTATVRWTVAKETGATLYLGTCYGRGNCTSPYSCCDLQVGHDGSGTFLHFKKIASQFSGDLTCAETLTNGTVLTDTSPLNVVHVSIPLSQLDIREDGSGSIGCNYSGHNSSKVTWSLTTNSEQTLELGTCTDVGSPHSSDITLLKKNRYSSRVLFQNIDRSKGGQLFCSYTYNGLTETDNATVNVYSPATVTNCHAEVISGNWSTILSCDVSNVFSSAGLYNVIVDERYFVFQHGKPSGPSKYVLDGHFSYRDMLTPFTNTTNNKLYYRGRLTHSWPLSPTPGIYSILFVHIYYGKTQHDDHFSFSENTAVYVNYLVNITTPSQPTHNCSELNYIPETGVVACVCTADFLGSPAGRLVWLVGNITMATGDYGVTQLTFPSGKVSRQHDGKIATCQLDWVQPMTTEFGRPVAYGPDILTLQVIPFRDVSNNTLINVASYVSGMKPLSAGIVQWGGLCQGQQGFMCTLTPNTSAEVDGKTVTYRVTNAANNGHSAEASVNINIFGFTQAQTNRDEFNGTAVGVGIVLSIVVIAFVVVIIVLYRRGRVCKRPTRHNSTSQDDESYYI